MTSPALGSYEDELRNAGADPVLLRMCAEGVTAHAKMVEGDLDLLRDGVVATKLPSGEIVTDETIATFREILAGGVRLNREQATLILDALVVSREMNSKAMCAWCGEVTSREGVAMVEHQMTCQKRTDAYHATLLEAADEIGELKRHIADVEKAHLGTIQRAAKLDGVDDALARAHKYIRYQPPGLPDHACAQCVPGGDIVIDGFVCAWHEAQATKPKGEK